MPNSDYTTVDYLRVALARLEDARVLLANSRTTGALYMAHYAVECSLKQLLIRRTTLARRASLRPLFQGTAGHDIQEIRKSLDRTRVRMSKRIRRELVGFHTGYNKLRYTDDAQSRHEAQIRVASAQAVVEWVIREVK